MYQENNVNSSGKILLVWDGTNDYLWHANHCLARNQSLEAIVIYPMPHERIYSIGNTNVRLACANSVEDLRGRFNEVARHSSFLRGLDLKLVFGERINEIIRFAREANVDKVLLPRFRQSEFSKWIHGDLNEQIVERASCPVLFLELEMGSMSGESDPNLNPLSTTEIM